jgi:hypothetical protein
MSNWDEIKRNVEENGGTASFTMVQLRDAAGKDKLGVNVRKEISKTLAGMGLGHIPQELPSYQHEGVRLYKRGTDTGDVIETVLSPGEQNDRKLKEYLNTDTARYAEIIEQIRDLVSE